MDRVIGASVIAHPSAMYRTATVQQYQVILEQARSTANSGNWSALTQCLQELLSSEATLFSKTNNAATLLDLALQVLEFGSFHDRWEISKLFPSFGIDAIAPLIELLDDEDADPESQWFAIRLLGDFNHPQVINALIDVIRTSQTEELCAIAISALANMGKTAIPVIESLLHDRATRLIAVQILGQIRHSEIVPLLLNVVTDEDAQVRAIAIEALSSFHSPEITAILAQALKDTSVPVRQAAVAGLGFCHPDDAQGVDLVVQLRPLLFDLNLEVCRQAAIALGRLKTPSAIAALSSVLSSPHTPENLAIGIIRALGWSNTIEGLNALQKALPDLTETHQLELINALGRVEASELKTIASKILLDLLRSDRSHLTKQAIALSLGQLGNIDAIEPLIYLLADSDVGVRLHVVSALKTLDAEIAHQRLEQMAHLGTNNTELQEGVAIALQEWNL